MTIFFTSDHHFSHKNIIQLCNRPFSSVEEMDEEMIRRWNNVVREEDFVYYLGDFSLSIKPVKEILPKLNGKKCLFTGNHDLCHPVHRDAIRKARFYYDSGIESILNGYGNPLFFGKEMYAFNLNHFPYDNGEDVRFRELFPVNKGGWLLHGHVHNKWKIKDKQINVGVDVWDFYPVSLDKILEIINSHKEVE